MTFSSNKNKFRTPNSCPDIKLMYLSLLQRPSKLPHDMLQARTLCHINAIFGIWALSLASYVILGNFKFFLPSVFFSLKGGKVIACASLIIKTYSQIIKTILIIVIISTSFIWSFLDFNGVTLYSILFQLHKKHQDMFIFSCL